MSLSPYRVNEIIIRAGVVGGMVAGGFGAVQVGLAPLTVGSPDTGTLRDLGDACLLASFATFFLVGFLVRRWTGWVDAAARAGGVAAVIASLLSCLAVALLGTFIPNTDAPGISGGSADTSVLLVLATLAIQGVASFGLAIAGALAPRPRTASDGERTNR
ncbi:MAG: hypothetical protein ACM3N4_08075 [Nitrososphaerota archaeon]